MGERGGISIVHQKPGNRLQAVRLVIWTLLPTYSLGRISDTISLFQITSIDKNMSSQPVFYNSTEYSLQDIHCQKTGSGRKILYLHGWTHSTEIWSPVINQISTSFTHITIDLAGFGKSKPAARSQIKISCFSQIVETFLRQESEQEPFYCTVGDSLGAILLLTMLNRGYQPAPRMLLSGCPANGLPFPFRCVAIPYLIRIPLFLIRKSPPWLSHRLIRLFCWATVSNPNTDIFPIIHSVLQTDPYTGEKIVNGLKNPFVITEKALQKPVMVRVIRGEKDRLVSKSASGRLAAMFNGVHLEIPNAGHTPMLENPLGYAEILSSLLHNS